MTCVVTNTRGAEIVGRATTVLILASIGAFFTFPQSTLAEERSNADGEALGMTRQVAQFIVNTKESDIPAEAYEHAKLAVLDWLGVTLAGASDPLVRKLVDFSASVGGIPQSSVLGYNTKKTVTQAALINGAASHTLDFDDSHAVFSGHPSASVVATVLALAEKERKSGRGLLAAYLVGLQAGFVVAESGGDEIYARGMHNTSALGVIASAAAAAHLLDLDEEQTLNALAIAATQSFGFKRSFGTMCKPLHAGVAAEAAVMAALLARDGFTGAADIFEGPNGLFEVWGGSVNEEALASLGREWGVKDLSVKYYASCHWTHGAIVTALQIADRDGVVPADITAIEFTVSPIAFETAGVIHPTTGLEGKFSIPYTAANALVTGNVGIQGFTDEAVKNTDIATLIDKTKIVTGDTGGSPFFTRATIETTDGKRYSATIDVMENLPGLDEKRVGVKKKFDDLVVPILGEEKAKNVEATILNLETVDDVSDINRSEGMQLIREFLIKAVEDPLSGYGEDDWPTRGE